MNIKYGLSAALVGVSIVMVQPQIARALSANEVDKIAESITVLIEGPGAGASGSGILIKREGNTYTVLTAQHVVNGQGTYSVITPDQKRYSLDYSTVKRLAGVDLAILTFTSEQSYSLAKLGDSTASSRGMNCYVTGFPGRGSAITEPTYVFTEGKLAAIGSRPQADGYALMYNNGTLPGMSGGPVLNDVGEVIGVHGRGVESSAKQSDINPNIAVIKTEYNLGIPINTFLALAPKVDSTLALRTPAPVSQSPKADDFFLQAEQKSKNSDYQGAIRDYDQAIALNPQYAEAYASRGDARASLSDFQGALKDVDQAIVLNPKLPEAYIVRGSIRGGLSDLQGALKDVDQAIALNPKLALSYANRALIRTSLNDFQGALKDADQAVALNPKDSNSYAYRTIIRTSLSDFQGALKDADQAVALNPKSVDAYLARASAHESLGDFQGALKDVDQAVALNPKSAGVYGFRGGIRGDLSDFQGALKDADQSIFLNPKYSGTYVLRANIRVSLKDFQGALKDADQAITLNSRNSYAYVSRASVYEWLKNYEKALSDANQAITLNSRNSGAYYIRGDINLTLKNYQQALDDVGQSITLNSNFANSYYLRGIIRSKLSDKEGALADFRKTAVLAQQQNNTKLYQDAQKSIQGSNSPIATQNNSPKGLVNEVWQIVNTTFVDGTFNHTDWKATRQQLLSKNYSSNEQAYSAIRVALKTLQDPYTRFVDPNQFVQENQKFSGELTGVGAKMALDKKTKVLTVVESIADSPAFRAGLKPGDQVLEVNGTSVYGLDIDKAVTLIRGKSGTPVKLKITRPRQKTFDITLTRQAIQLSVIISALKQEGRNRIGYIRLSEFTDNADIQMKKAIQSLENQNIQAFVLDLRGNPGGSERMAVAISRLWINDGKILSTVERDGNSRVEEANHSAITNLPLVVLVDGNSASASEIVAGALKENRRAIIVGTRTFGKGVVQSMNKLSDGSGVIVTTGNYFTPNGNFINHKGISPDVEIKLTTAQVQNLSNNPQLIGSPSDPQYATAVQAVSKLIQ